jgi:hypothetical protein
VSEDFELVALKPRSYNELEFDAGAEPGALNAERGLGLRRDRIKYDDPSSETVCSRVYKIVEDCRLSAHYTDNGREYTPPDRTSYEVDV